MASFRYRNNRWQARVRRNGHPDEVRTFLIRQDAERWARSVETDMDRGSYTNQNEAQKHTLGDLLERYVAEVLPGNPHEKLRAYRFNKLAGSSIGRVNMTGLSPISVSRYRDERLAEVTPGTVIRELACISSVINHARREWGIHVVNPVPLVRKPSTPKCRERTLTPEELQRLLAVLEPIGKRSPWMSPLVLLALETAMRRGELLALRWADVDLAGRTATLPVTKNGDRRVVPLSTRALELLNGLPRSIDGRVFPMTGFAVSKAWDTAIVRANLPDAHFHDLRHMALTRLMEKLPNVLELAAVSGHRSLKMLKRYVHPDPKMLALKLG